MDELQDLVYLVTLQDGGGWGDPVAVFATLKDAIFCAKMWTAMEDFESDDASKDIEPRWTVVDTRTDQTVARG